MCSCLCTHRAKIYILLCSLLAGWWLGPSSFILNCQLPPAALVCSCPPRESGMQADQRLHLDKCILQVPPGGDLCPLPHPELSPVLPAPPPASFPLSFAACQGKRHLSGKANETGLPKPGRVERAWRGDPVPPKMARFTLERLHSSFWVDA